MATGIPSKAKHQGAGTIPPRAALLPPNGTKPTPPGTSRLPRRIQSHKSLLGTPAAQTVNPDSPPNANFTLIDAFPESLEDKNWPLLDPENLPEHHVLEPISLSGLSNIDPITVSSFDRAADDNNGHVRSLCHSSSSAASTGTAPVLRIAADADAVILGTADDDTSPVPTIPSKIPKGPSIPSKIPKAPTYQSSLGTFRDRIAKATDFRASPSVTPPAQKTCPTGLIADIGSGPKINPIRSMKPARKLGPDGSSPMSPSSLTQSSVTPSTTGPASAAFSDAKLATKDLDEPTEPEASAFQFERSVGQCVSTWSSPSPSPSAHTTHSHSTVRNQDSNKTRATKTATFNTIGSSSGYEPPQRRQSDDSNKQLDEQLDDPDKQSNSTDDQLNERSDEESDEQSYEDSDEESDEQSYEESDEGLAASPAAPPPLRDMPSNKNQSTLQRLKAQRSIRDIFSRKKSRANPVEEAPPPLPHLPHKQGFLSAFRSKSHANLAEEARPTKQGLLGIIRSKSRVNLGESAPPIEQGFIKATSSSLAEAMPNPNDRPMPSTIPDVAVHSTRPARKPVPKDPETRRTELLEAIDRLAQKPDNLERRQLHLRIAKAVKEVVKLTNLAEISEAKATQSSVNAAGDSRKAEEFAKLAEDCFKKSKRWAEEANHFAGSAETWAKNAKLMAREADISRARAQQDADHAQEQVKELWEVLEAAGLEAESLITIEELARELVNYRNPWTE